MDRTDTGRRHSLDAMRGLAALAVVLFHTGWLCGLPLFPGGYLAVDFFFALSGYVIAGAYGARLGGNLTVARFIEVRFVRLYPLFALGIALGVVRSLAQLALGRDSSLGGVELAAATVCNLLMLPTPFRSAALFPLNPPAWSLFMEVSINIFYAIGLYRFRTRDLCLLVIVAGGCLAAAALRSGGVSRGVDWADLASGAARTAFSFSVGLLIADRARTGRRRRTWLACLPAAALVVLLAAPLGRLGNGPVDLAAIFLVLPLLVWAGSILEPPDHLRPAAAFLGDISYPIYAVHFPLLLGAWFVFGRLVDATVFATGFVCLLVTTAWLLARYVDQPVRNRLSGWLHLHRSTRL